MHPLHGLTATAGANGIIFECDDGCGRRLAIDRAGRFTVIDKGDPSALHRGALGDVDLATAEVVPG